jgi:CheY-like chemotaxis protein
MAGKGGGSAVPRTFVLVMNDGSVAVQWDATRVQDILTGAYRDLPPGEVGQPAGDAELTSLMAAGRVEYFNRAFVWLYALPEANRYPHALHTQERIPGRVRLYYLNTTLPADQVNAVQAALDRLQLAEQMTAQVKDDRVIVRPHHLHPLEDVHAAERIQEALIERSPELFAATVVAFYETDVEAVKRVQEIVAVDEVDSLDELIASVTDVSVTENRSVLLLMVNEDERNTILDLCLQLRMTGRVATTAADALQFLQEESYDLLLMDLLLPDAHGWELLGRLAEQGLQQRLITIVLADATATSEISLSPAAPHVDLFLVKPVSFKRLREQIWFTFRKRQAQ